MLGWWGEEGNLLKGEWMTTSNVHGIVDGNEIRRIRVVEEKSVVYAFVCDKYCGFEIFYSIKVLPKGEHRKEKTIKWNELIGK